MTSPICIAFYSAPVFIQTAIFAVLGVGMAGVVGAGFFALSRQRGWLGVAIIAASALLWFGVGWLARHVGYCSIQRQ